MNDDKINVLLCVTDLSYGMGGVTTHIIDLCKQYSRNPAIGKVVVCCEGGERKDEIIGLDKVQYLETTFRSDGTNFLSVVKSYGTLRKVALREHIDIIHVHSQRLLYAAYFLKIFHRIPFVWTNHIDAIPQPKRLKRMIRFMKFPVISVSQELRTILIRDYACDPKNDIVVNNGVDLDSLQPLTADEKRHLEEKYNIDRETTPYVICELSRIASVKGQMKLLTAINCLEEKDRIHVIIAGDDHQGGYFEEIVKFIEDHSIHATLLPFSKPRDVFGVSDLFVLPSTAEGFPMVCVEALAVGCAVIRTRTPGWQELNAWEDVVDIDDAGALLQAIHSAIKNNFYQERSETGRQVVSKRFTKEVCADRTIEVYKRVISGHSLGMA